MENASFAVPKPAPMFEFAKRNAYFCRNLQFYLDNPCFLTSKDVRNLSFAPQGFPGVLLTWKSMNYLSKTIGFCKSCCFTKVCVSLSKFKPRRRLWDSKTCVFHCILQGSVQMLRKAQFDEKHKNLKKALCSTALDACPQTQRNEN